MDLFCLFGLKISKNHQKMIFLDFLGDVKMNKCFNLDLVLLKLNDQELTKFYKKVRDVGLVKPENSYLIWLNEEIGRLKNYQSERDLYKLENTNLFSYYCFLVSSKYALFEVPF